MARTAPAAFLLLAAACSGGAASDVDALDSAQRAADGDAPAAVAAEPAAPPGGDPAAQDPSLPLVYDVSGAPAARVVALVKSALDGLGFDRSSAEGPNANDRVFVGKRYLAWIDQTGFYGKMNGLWALNGAAGDALDFVVKDPDGRPVNTFIVGENGEGRFAGGYKGAEHVEFPSRVPEANDDPSCASRDWCNQYGLDEAPPITNPRIPWWSACNRGAAGYDRKVDPVIVQRMPGGGLKLVYEGPLVKEADGDGNYDGDACHEDYLFPDKVRRRVILRVGYELFADEDHFDRTQQLVNPAGNPTLAGDMSLIGGFVMTAWPSAHYQKRLERFWRPETNAIEIDWSGKVRLPAATWTSLVGRPNPTKDVVVAWANQPFSVSATNDYAAGRSATVANVGPSDNGDVGGCLCVVHGAIELGGGLIHAGTSLPIAGGQTTIEAKRRLTIPSTNVLGAVAGRSYDPRTALSHGVGRAETDGWSAATGPDAKGHMLYGPYATDWGGGAAEVAIALMVDDVVADDLPVVTIELYDADAGAIVGARAVHRKELRRPMTLQRFTLDAALDGRQGHRMEVRVYWHDVSYVKVGSVKVATTDR